MNDLTIVPSAAALSKQRTAMLRAVNAGLQRLEQADTAEEVLEIERQLEAIEHAMHATGLFKPDEVREANEGKIRARWKLGRLLKELDARQGWASNGIYYAA